LAKDTLLILDDVLSALDHGENRPYSVFDETTGTFVQRSAEQVYQLLPEILAHASRRHPIVGLTTKEMRYRQRTIGWNDASRLEGGNVTLAGGSLASIMIPHGGIYDYLQSAILRVKSMLSETPNRVVRRQESIFHHRVDRPNGGGAFSPKLLETLDNPDSRTYGELRYAILNDPRLQARIMALFGIPATRSELLFGALRSEYVNFQQLADIATLRRSVLQHLQCMAQTSASDAQISQAVEAFVSQFADPMIEQAQRDLFLIPDAHRLAQISKGIRRELAMYTIWPQLVEAAYALGTQTRPAVSSALDTSGDQC
jgi:hypothetical protein